jgi:protein-tyrosine phosphatase
LIDIHSHILPGLDDGSQSMEETLAMLKMAAADGITGVVATPHVNNSIYPNSKETIIAKVEEVNRLLQSEHIPISVFPGAEIRLEPDLPERMAKKELLTINNTGSYLLIELPAEFIPTYTEQSLYELQLQGVIPIIAHPERCSVFIRIRPA